MFRLAVETGEGGEVQRVVDEEQNKTKISENERTKAQPTASIAYCLIQECSRRLGHCLTAGGDEAVPLDEPGGVVGLPKIQQGLPQLLDGVEGLHLQEVLLQRTDEAFGASVALGRPDEGGRTGDAEEGDLFLEGVGHVLRSVIVPDGQAVALANPPKCRRTPWRIGSSVWKRVTTEPAAPPTRSPR